MQKAMFFEEAFKTGVLAKVTDGYIMSITFPNLDDIDSQNDPILIEMISYSGVKSIFDIGNGVKFQAQGKKMFCMLEPTSYPDSHIEPVNRSQNKTGYIPYRFNECESFLTKDSKFRVLIPKKAFDCYDSFTVSFPHKGDLSILYFIFDKDIDKVVLPFIHKNFQDILMKSLSLRANDLKTIADKFFAVVAKFKLMPSKQ